MTETLRPQGRVLIVAGSDSSGGAGIQADIKAVSALGGYAMTAITALTAQNTTGVYGVVGTDPAFIQQQMRLALEDIGADAIKTGMLHSPEVIEAVAEVVAEVPEIPLVVDPVMVSQSGHSLIGPDAVRTLVRRLLPFADLITPNLPEAEKLGADPVRGRAEMAEAAQVLLTLGCEAVLLKGGHLEDESVMRDVLASADQIEIFEDPRIDTRHTHGTGCTLASSIATGLAQGLALPEAVARARRYLREALASAPGFGKGQGPVNHLVTVRPFA